MGHPRMEAFACLGPASQPKSVSRYHPGDQQPRTLWQIDAEADEAVSGKATQHVLQNACYKKPHGCHGPREPEKRWEVARAKNCRFDIAAIRIRLAVPGDRADLPRSAMLPQARRGRRGVCRDRRRRAADHAGRVGSRIFSEGCGRLATATAGGRAIKTASASAGIIFAKAMA